MKRKVIHKVFWMWGFEREERWLNDMAALGWNLVDTNGVRYVFDQGEPGEYRYKLELLKSMPNVAESQRYLRFMEDAGIDQVASCGRWVYFRRRAEDGPFDLFSDLDSRVAHLRRIRRLFLTVLVVELLAVVLQIIAYGHIYSPDFKQVLGPVYFAIVIALLIITVALIIQTIRITRHISRLNKERAIRE